MKQLSNKGWMTIGFQVVQSVAILVEDWLIMPVWWEEEIWLMNIPSTYTSWVWLFMYANAFVVFAHFTDRFPRLQICAADFFFFFLPPAYMFRSHPCQQDVWVEKQQGIYDVWCMCTSVRVTESGQSRAFLWFIHVCPGISLLPVLVTWLLSVAGTTYKPAVIKVFDLLSLPTETHISRPANTTLLPLWSMTEGEARATNWQCRDWTRGVREWWGRVAEERQKKLVKRKSEWDKGEVRADEVAECKSSMLGCTFGKNIKFSLLPHSTRSCIFPVVTCFTQLPK